MKNSEILSILDLSKKESFYSIDELLNEFNVEISDIDVEKITSKLSYIWIIAWYCTDTWVGVKILLLDDEPVCFITQLARRSDQEFEWISNETFSKVKKIIEEAKIEKENRPCLIKLNQEFGHFYKIAFADHLIFPIHKIAILNGKAVLIEKIDSNKYCEDKVKVIFSDNKSEIVSLDKLEFPLLGLK